MTAARGRQLAVHFEARAEVPPHLDTAMQIHWDWETWLNEGIMDELTLICHGSGPCRQPSHFADYAARRWLRARPEPGLRIPTGFRPPVRRTADCEGLPKAGRRATLGSGCTRGGVWSTPTGLRPSSDGRHVWAETEMDTTPLG